MVTGTGLCTCILPSEEDVFERGKRNCFHLQLDLVASLTEAGYSPEEHRQGFVEDDADKLAGPNGLMRDWGYGLKREWRAFEPNKARFATFIARARLAREQERQRRSILRVLAEGAAAAQRGSAGSTEQKPTFELKRSRAFVDAENEEKKEHSLLDDIKEVDGMKFKIKQDDPDEERKGDLPHRASPSPSPRAAAAAAAAATWAANNADDMHLRIHIGSDSSDSARLLPAAASPSPFASASTVTSPSKAGAAASPSSIRLLTSPQQSSSKLSAPSGSSSGSAAVRSPVSADQFAQMMAQRTNSKPLVFFGQCYLHNNALAERCDATYLLSFSHKY
jgi:hypothetical protein